MPSTTTATKKTTAAKAPAEITLNSFIQAEITRLAGLQQSDEKTLEEFAYFVIANYKKKEPKVKVVKIKPLSLPQLKAAIFKHFEVENLKELRASGSFQMATSGLGKLDLSKKPGWETLYRKYIGVLPEEENETGYGCINGINIFKYDMPWKAFGLNSQVATTEDVKLAYRNLSKIYHPDMPETGDAKIFDRLNTFYKSLTEKF